MKSNAELLNVRKERVRKAVALEKVDRTPVVLQMDAFCAKHMGAPMDRFAGNLRFSNEVMVESMKALGDFEGSDFAFAAARVFPFGFMTKVKMPGKELPADALWQLDEREVMTREDYDTILTKGWADFEVDYLKNRLGFPMEEVLAELTEVPQMVKNVEDAGYVVYSPLVINLVNEKISGGRSMPGYMKDLFQCPDKVEAVIDVIQETTLVQLREAIRATNSQYVFISPARGASEFFRPKLWERFVWKYLKQVADAIIEEGAVINFHIDSNWERDLEFFKCFPKGTAVFETDGVTDIRKIKEVIGDTMCIKGDVPAAMLTLGNPDQVYDYCRKLISDMGTGFILSGGCSLPPNAKLENVLAMIAAAKG